MKIRYDMQVMNIPRTYHVSGTKPLHPDPTASPTDLAKLNLMTLGIVLEFMISVLRNILQPTNTTTMSSHLLPIALLILVASASIPPQNHTACPTHLYSTHILSTDPLVIYIPNFITLSESQHLQSISAGKFTSSQIADSSGQQHLASTRTSQSTSLESDEIVTCIERRALAFQGFDTLRESLEPLQLVQYGQSQEYHSHTDWFTSPAQTTAEYGGNRLSSFFVYVHASDDIVGGGTQFPLLDAPVDERWCKYVDCDAEIEDGVTFRPVQGNAVFWRNLKWSSVKKEHVGDGRTVHAGLPVQRGRKLGMNVWTRERALDEKFRSGGD
jgi:prolyl 4-hydroxylase